MGTETDGNKAPFGTLFEHGSGLRRLWVPPLPALRSHWLHAVAPVRPRLGCDVRTTVGVVHGEEAPGVVGFWTAASDPDFAVNIFGKGAAEEIPVT